jgi:hypothetical protein
VSIDLQVELKPNYVHLHCRGAFRFDALLEVWESAFRVAIDEGRKAVLVDLRGLEGAPPTTIERYEQGVRFAEVQQRFGLGILIAVVGHEPLMDPEKFGETVGKNRGGFGAVFTDIDEAVDWIEGEARQ